MSPSMIIDSDKIVALLRQVAAEEVMPRWQNLEQGDISFKAGQEPLTVADTASEAALSAGLTALLPGSRVVGEEGVSEDPARLDWLNGGDWVWVVDPIDGTENFSRGRPHFALMIALVRKGKTEAAWIYAPALDRLAIAMRGEGAQVDGQTTRVPDNPNLAADLRGTIHAGHFAPRAMAQKMSRRRERVDALRSLNSAGIEYLRLLACESDFAFFTKLKPWDHAPGCLLLREAGAVARFTDSKAAYNPLRHEGEGLLLASDEGAWERLHETLLGEN